MDKLIPPIKILGARRANVPRVNLSPLDQLIFRDLRDLRARREKCP